jgi:hypothetical protein
MTFVRQSHPNWVDKSDYVRNINKLPVMLTQTAQIKEI